MSDGCFFCGLTEESYALENGLAFAFIDSHPVSKGHSLIIPKRHFSSYFDATEEELAAIRSLLGKRKDDLLREDPAITGFNIGVNVGASAGQSVFHLHVHLIPRRDGDTPDPKGGVRGVIPGKMRY